MSEYNDKVVDVNVLLPSGSGEGSFGVDDGQFHTEDTNSVKLLGNGTGVAPLKAGIKIDTTVDNALVVGPGGVSVGVSPAPGNLATIDGGRIMVAAPEIDVPISSKADNNITKITTPGEEGLYAPPGEKGDPGEKGEKGDPGVGVYVIGKLEEVTQLPPPSGYQAGDTFVINKHYHTIVMGQWLDLGDFSGPDGETGPAGPEGPEGTQGIQGEQGVKGDPGTNVRFLGRVAQLPTTGMVVGDSYFLGTVLKTWNGTIWIDGGDFQGVKGDIGPEGPQGIQGIRGPQGIPGVVWKGVWSSSVTYSEGDGVSHSGSSWVSRATLTGDEPGVGAQWDLLAKAGEKGADGAQGIQGPQGNPGDPGTDGAKGDPGATWILGAAAPAPEVGKIGDLFINQSTFDYYSKTDETTWTLEGKIVGIQDSEETNPEAPQGRIKGQWITVPQEAPTDGSFYVRQNSGWYRLNRADWVIPRQEDGVLDAELAQTWVINGELSHTLTFTNLPPYRSMWLTIVVNGNTGTVTLPANILWDGGTAPTIAGTRTVLQIFWDGEDLTGKAIISVP